MSAYCIMPLSSLNVYTQPKIVATVVPPTNSNRKIMIKKAHSIYESSIDN